MKGFSDFAGQRAARLRPVLPSLLMALLFALGLIHMNFPFLGALRAPLFLMGIYYWALYRPTLVPAWAVFAAGCLMDLLGALPLGLSAFVYLVFQWIAMDQRRFLMGQNFLMIWFGFCLLSLAAALTQWAIYGLLQLHWPPPGTLAMSTVLGFTLFPAVYMLLHLSHKILPAPQGRARLNS